MKINLIAFFIVLVLCGCGKTENNEYLFTANFIKDNPGWRTTNDTISKSLIFEQGNFKMPLEVLWVPAKDENDCYRIGYMRVKKNDFSKKVKVSNFSVNNIPCAMKFEDVDERRFESILMKCKIDSRVGIQEYIFEGTIGTINGLGEMTNISAGD